MSERTGRHSDHNRVHGHRTSRVHRGWLPALLVLLLVPVILVLKVPTATTGTVPCDCETCHVDPHAGGFTGCTSCHGAPPATGSHQVHFDNAAPVDGLRYGDPANRSTAVAYIFDCGNCHPLVSAGNHMNGTVDVQLYNAAAPIESLKAKNPASAAYDNVAKTCSNVYCHSGLTVTSGPVGLPLTSPPNPVPPGYQVINTYIMDRTGSNLTYDPYTVNFARVYKTTPAWGTSSGTSTCAECHAFPITTSYPANSAGVGDSHAWIDDYGYQDGHAWNMGYGGIPCATCHYSSVDHVGGVPPTNPPAPATYPDPSNTDINIYYPVPVKDRSLHVNGTPNVAFDTVNGYRYFAARYNHLRALTSATYDAQTKTCSNVGCHFGTAVGGVDGNLQQQNPKWGQPYRWYVSPECNLCHRY